MRFRKLKDISKYNQNQILTFEDSLSEEEKNKLYEEIDKIDFKLMDSLYRNSFFDDVINIKDYSMCTIINKTKLDDISNSVNLIRNNGYAIVIMAGGNGSRLGFDGPKGSVKVGNKSLFQIYIDKLLDVYKKYGVYINLYIMTSSLNNNRTIEFFEDNDYFGYNKDYIKFFIQKDLPILDTSGKILLKDRDHILFGPNGNGDVFDALRRNGLIRDMVFRNIRYVLFTGIDNPAVNLVDFDLLEIILKNRYGLVNKTIFKNDTNDMSGVFCKCKGRPSMLSTDDLTKEMMDYQIDGEYAFRDKNTLYHIISLSNIIKFSRKKLRYHRSYKKSNYMDLKGNIVEVTKPNTFKFEQLIYDAFYYADDMILYRVDESEFMPIKNKEDLDRVNKYFEVE